MLRPLLLSRPFLSLLATGWLTCGASAADLDVVNIAGETLKGNPLGDPPARRVAVFSPDAMNATRLAPLVIYLPGWGDSSENAIGQGDTSLFAQAVDRLATRGIRLRLAVVDGRSRYGGSQFLNSSATGNYADYIAKEIVPTLKARYAVPAKAASSVILAGHSSGAYGALMLASSHQKQFDAVVALSPDSDFETTHKPLVQTPAVRAVTPEILDAAMARTGGRLPSDGHVCLVLGLCANYAPIPGKPGRFEWLYDSKGEWQPEAWKRWIDLDPFTVVRRRADAFAPEQRVYLDGAERDEFGANIGARKIHEVLRERQSPVTFYESQGGHSDHLLARLVRGLTWVMDQQ